MTKGSLAVLLGSLALLVAILAVAVHATISNPGPGGAAAELVPASALAFARLSTDPDDPAARQLMRLAPKLPGYARARDAALTAISPAAGGFDLERDVRPWLGDEAAGALVDLGGGRFGSLVIAEVKSRPRAEALLQRVAGARPGARYGKTVIRRFGDDAAAFAQGFLVAGPEPAVQRSIDAARGDAPSLADSATFGRSLEGAPRPAQVYVSPRGLRAAPPGGVTGVIATLLSRPGMKALGAAVGADDDGLRVRVRSVGTSGPKGGSAAALTARVPAGAIAMLAAPDAAAVVAAVEKVGGAAAVDSVRTVLTEQAALDADRDIVGRLEGGFAAWLSRGDAAPVIGLAARTDDPKGLRVALARLQDPIASALARDAESPPVFEARRVAGTDAYSLPVSDGFAPTYAVAGDTVVVATAPAGVEAFLTPGGPRLAETPAFRSAIPSVRPTTESLGFFDVRQLLALGEQTGLTAEDLRPVHAASAVIQREEDDTTAELFFEIP
jgi:hypothetical protein